MPRKAKPDQRDLASIKRQLKELQRALTKQWKIAEDESMIVTVTTTPSGKISSKKPKWPAGVRQKAAKDAAVITRQIANVEKLLAEREAAEKRGEAVELSTGAPFQFVVSGKPLEELIEENLRGGEKPN